MEESAEEAEKRQEILRIYNSTKEALRIIDDIARDKIDLTASSSLSLTNTLANTLIKFQPEQNASQPAAPQRPAPMRQQTPLIHLMDAPLNPRVLPSNPPPIFRPNLSNSNSLNSLSNQLNKVPPRNLPGAVPPAIPKRPSVSSVNGLVRPPLNN